MSELQNAENYLILLIFLFGGDMNMRTYESTIFITHTEAVCRIEAMENI